MEKHQVFIVYGTVSITGPVIGVVCGGVVSTRLGGYNSPKSLYFTAFLSFLAIFVAVPIPYMVHDLVGLQIFFLWCMLFIGGMILPSLMGVMLN